MVQSKQTSISVHASLRFCEDVWRSWSKASRAKCPCVFFKRVVLVNRGLQKTLKESLIDFWLTTTACRVPLSEVKFQPVRKDYLLLEGAKDFQIVNGAQTTRRYSMHKKKAFLMRTRFPVQVKLTVSCDQEKGLEFVPLISRYGEQPEQSEIRQFFLRTVTFTEN